MASTISLFFLVLLLPFQCSSTLLSLNKGSSLSVEKNAEDIIVSPNGMFSAGFFQVGKNAFSFAIWFTELQLQPHTHNPTNVVWMANRDQPVNGKLSKLSLLKTGNIVLFDAGRYNTWSSNTASKAPSELQLRDDGNLVLSELRGGTILWQSFDFPTNTLIPNQPLTRHTTLVSSRSDGNYSSGFYKLFFDDNNFLRLGYDGPDVSSTYWATPSALPGDAGMVNYNSSRVAVLDSHGKFISSDNYSFSTYDYGMVLQRRLTMDFDGNVRVYSRKNLSEKWYVTWQVIDDTCIIHGICGANSTCNYDPEKGKKCSCLPGYKVKNHKDWSYGCEPKFDVFCKGSESTFLEMRGVELYGYDNNFVQNSSYKNCESLCLQDCNCKGFQYKYEEDENQGIFYFNCYTKPQLLNGRRSPTFKGTIYLRLPKGKNFSQEESMSAYDDVCLVQLHKDYAIKPESRLVRFFLWLAISVGGLEAVCVLVVWVSYLGPAKSLVQINRGIILQPWDSENIVTLS